jgi:hypothetical protein
MVAHEVALVRVERCEGQLRIIELASPVSASSRVRASSVLPGWYGPPLATRAFARVMVMPATGSISPRSSARIRSEKDLDERTFTFMVSASARTRST